ncbi:MAG TPA: ATP-binding protein [Candidatus Aquilonibacter sp.]|nr:ATP-binding protein [Candidatus Aquilonibacter sp.]
MANERSKRDFRTIILAPTGRDAQLIAGVIERSGNPCHIVSTVGELSTELRAGAGAAILAEEACKGDAINELKPVLSEQPPWSDFPLILLTAGGRVTVESERLRQFREPLGNVLLLERPIRPETLLSTLATALRGRQRQYQIRDQIRTAELAQEALRRSEKLAVTGRLAASIAHEINNPLESVTNLLYLARTETDPGLVGHYLSLADQELARVTEITKHTLRFYREPNHPSKIDLVAVVDSVLSLYSSRLNAAGVTVAKQVRSRSVLFTAPLGELRQVIANIVGNALDAMRNGGRLALRISVEDRSWRREGKVARLTISDNGTGIPHDLMLRIFEPFITTKGETGTGLGLWVTAEIARKNGWSIHVRSSTNPRHSGTTFSFLLPLAADAAEPELVLAATAS